jgi:hypothetical protein
LLADASVEPIPGVARCEVGGDVGRNWYVGCADRRAVVAEINLLEQSIWQDAYVEVELELDETLAVVVVVAAVVVVVAVVVLVVDVVLVVAAWLVVALVVAAVPTS